ncbi:MAG: hypothetical protein V8Q75_06535 [Bacilli bacterium]
MYAIIGSLITGGLAFAGVLVTNSSNNKKIINDVDKKMTEKINDIKLEVVKNQAVTDTKLDELTREVREHNNFARRMPVVEEQIKVINHRIKDLEEEGR